MNGFAGWFRRVLIVVACGAALNSPLCYAKLLSQAASKKPPNIVFIFSDDHAYQAISAYNDPRRLIDTPHIDRLAREGMRFDRCVVPNSICGPSRASVLTGKYSHLNGFYNNTNSRFDGSQTTFPKLLHAAGYQTAMIGKWHLVTDPTGFDEWHILPGQGVYYNPPMIHNGQQVKHQGYTTDIITELSLDWLKKRDKSKPFLLMCQHKAPHREWLPAIRHLGHDHDRRYPEPPTLFDDYSGRGKAEHDQDMTIAKTMTAIDLKLTPPKELDVRRAPGLGRLLRAAQRRLPRRRAQGQGPRELEVPALHARLPGLHQGGGRERRPAAQVPRRRRAWPATRSSSTRPTRAFISANMAGSTNAGSSRNRCGHPCLVRWPGVVKPGSANSSLVSNIDFAETFLDAAGLPIPAEMQGRSLVPLLKGQTPRDWRSSFYYQYFEYPVPHHVRPHYGVVTDRYKLVHFDGPDLDEWELFDLEKDPHELRSVYGDPAYATVVADLKRELDRLRAELKVPATIPQEAYGQVIRSAIVQKRRDRNVSMSSLGGYRTA